MNRVKSITSTEDLLEDVDVFYRRIVQYIMNKIEGVETDNILCYTIDEYDNLTTMLLENSGDNFEKSLGQAMRYFEAQEEYETCELIKQMKQTLNIN